MKKQKGVVMGLEGKNVILYTDEGDFVRLPMPRKTSELGDVIEVGSKAPKLLASYFAVAAALVLVAAIGLFYPLFGPGAAAAYVALDINPSAELVVNRDGVVVKARPLNQDAESLLAEVSVDGQDVYGAVESIVREAGRRGYLSKDHENMVLAGIVPLKGDMPTVQEDKLRQVIHDELVEMQASGEIVVSKGAGETRKQAEKAGLSVNKYLVYDRARQEGIDIPIDALRSNSVREVLGQAGIPLKRIFPAECVEVRQAGQQPADNGGPASTESGMRTGSPEHSYSDGMGHGGGHSGAVGNMNGHGPAPMAPDSGSMMPDHAGSEPAGQPGGTQKSQPGGMEMAPQGTGGNMSGPAGGHAGASTSSSQGHSNGEMQMAPQAGTAQVSGPLGRVGGGMAGSLESPAGEVQAVSPAGAGQYSSPASHDVAPDASVMGTESGSTGSVGSSGSSSAGRSMR